MEQKVRQIKVGVSNAFLIGDKGNTLVDTGSILQENKISKIFRKLKMDPKNIDLIIITHGHLDHFGNIHKIKQLSSAKVLCHRNAMGAIREGKGAPVVARNFIGKIGKKSFPDHLGDYDGVNPDIIMEDTYDLMNYKVSGEVKYTPGHTDCSISVILDSGVAIVGDMLMAFPILSKKPFRSFFTNHEEKLDFNIKKLLMKNIKVFYAGHGGPFERISVMKLFEK